MNGTVSDLIRSISGQEVPQEWRESSDSIQLTLNQKAGDFVNNLKASPSLETPLAKISVEPQFDGSLTFAIDLKIPVVGQVSTLANVATPLESTAAAQLAVKFYGLSADDDENKHPVSGNSPEVYDVKEALLTEFGDSYRT